MKWLRLLAVVAMFTPTLCLAAPVWSVVLEKSRLGFQATQAGGTITGAFKRFEAAITFDPADLTSSHVHVTIDIASITTDAPDRDAELPKPEWFDIARFPQATFISTRFKALGGDNYLTEGILTIRDVRIPISLPFTLKIDDGVATVRASLELDRATFGVGQGDWASSDVIGHNVTVIVELKARSSS
ncbi:YceI family protein [Agrobacterium rhizogenes]|uniref:YceI family protein n=1 Tax=Rhizobium rhizogenes TaxID=359 RepID=UPI0013754EBA|nr:YceI family protein [Rhizobium rhizogenes]NTG04951.1 YceI family protein [Rhizobium rhizogenes]NTG32279.1 YceI family protein [Rhizobium rhizogenes]NTG38746.1 YceI family protein [Rhizobium rhizogenes]NTG58553.1 YceI family protein [Rhizobium rhizogenes]